MLVCVCVLFVYLAVGQNPCTHGEHQNRWQMDARAPPKNAGSAPWPFVFVWGGGSVPFERLNPEVSGLKLRVLERLGRLAITMATRGCVFVLWVWLMGNHKLQARHFIWGGVPLKTKHA